VAGPRKSESPAVAPSPQEDNGATTIMQLPPDLFRQAARAPATPPPYDPAMQTPWQDDAASPPGASVPAARRREPASGVTTEIHVPSFVEAVSPLLPYDTAEVPMPTAEQLRGPPVDAPTAVVHLSSLGLERPPPPTGSLAADDASPVTAIMSSAAIAQLRNADAHLVDQRSIEAMDANALDPTGAAAAPPARVRTTAVSRMRALGVPLGLCAAVAVGVLAALAGGGWLLFGRSPADPPAQVSTEPSPPASDAVAAPVAGKPEEAAAAPDTASAGPPAPVRLPRAATSARSASTGESASAAFDLAYPGRYIREYLRPYDFRPQEIESFGREVKRCKGRFVVTGYSDEEGGETVSRALGRKRAEVVKEMIVAYGVDPARVETIGAGGNAPLAENDTEENRQQSHRVIVRCEP